MLNVRKRPAPVCFAASAATAVESMPPLRNTPHRHVRHQTLLDSAIEALEQLLSQCLLGPPHKAFVRLDSETPVALDDRFPFRLHDQVMSRRQLPDSRDEGMRRRDKSVCKKLLEGLTRHAAGRARVFQQGRQLEANPKVPPRRNQNRGFLPNRSRLRNNRWRRVSQRANAHMPFNLWTTSSPQTQ